jgi:hypothetical protein
VAVDDIAAPIRHSIRTGTAILERRNNPVITALSLVANPFRFAKILLLVSHAAAVRADKSRLVDQQDIGRQIAL